MKTYPLKLLTLISVLALLSGCATDNIGSPCKDFGKHCQKTPINSWNYHQNG